MSDTPLSDFEVDETDEHQNVLVEPLNHTIEVKKVGTKPHVVQVRKEGEDEV